MIVIGSVVSSLNFIRKLTRINELLTLVRFNRAYTQQQNRIRSRSEFTLFRQLNNKLSNERKNDLSLFDFAINNEANVFIV